MEFRQFQELRSILQYVNVNKNIQHMRNKQII